MRKKTGWVWILVAVFLFIVNFFTLGNQVIITAKWAGITSMLIEFVLCPALIIIGIGILIMGKKR